MKKAKKESIKCEYNKHIITLKAWKIEIEREWETERYIERGRENDKVRDERERKIEIDRDKERERERQRNRDREIETEK